eukprot:8405587-Pyramimonas_sp.AAC.1
MELIEKARELGAIDAAENADVAALTTRAAEAQESLKAAAEAWDEKQGGATESGAQFAFVSTWALGRFSGNEEARRA